MQTLLIVLVLLVSACRDTSTNQFAATSAVAVAAKLRASGDALDGTSVVIRGFLYPLSGHLTIYPNQQAAANAKHFENAVFVRDTTPMRMMRREGLYYERKCTGRYVELTGVVGYIEPYGFYGVTKIATVVTYDDESFEDSGELCYSVDQPSIYQPVDLKPTD